MHLTFSSWARCCSCNPATSCHLCSSNARRPFSLLLNCCIIMDNCLQKKKKIGSYTRSSLKIIYNLKENNKATEMFYNQHVLCSKLILFHGTSTFFGENFIVLKKVDNKMNEQGIFISLFSDIFSQKFEKHFFSTGTMFCIFFFKVVHLLLQLVYGLFHPLLFILLL